MVTGSDGNELSRARSVLAALADAGGSAALPAGEALATVDDVYPPRPPVPRLLDQETPTLAGATAALAAAAAAAADPVEAARIAAAGQALRTPLPG